MKTQKLVITKKTFEIFEYDYDYNQIINRIHYKKNTRNKFTRIISQNSINRTKSTLKRLINNNDFKYFITLTFAENITDLNNANKCFNSFIKSISSVLLNFSYIAVPEFQKRGAVHYHLLVNCDDLTKQILDVYWTYGFTFIKNIKTDQFLHSYLTKYLSKDNSLLDPRFFSKKKFFTSQNINKPTVLYGNFFQNIHTYLSRFYVLLYQNAFTVGFLGDINYSLYSLIRPLQQIDLDFLCSYAILKKEKVLQITNLNTFKQLTLF